MGEQQQAVFRMAFKIQYDELRHRFSDSDKAGFVG